MSRIRIFQLAVITSAALYAVWLLLPYAQLGYSAGSQQLLGMSGYGAAPFVQHPAFYLSIAAAKLLASVGLLFFAPWSRWLLLAVIAVSLCSVPYSGVTVSAPLDGFIGSLAGLADGIVLALAFWSPIAQGWTQSDASDQA